MPVADDEYVCTLKAAASIAESAARESAPESTVRVSVPESTTGAADPESTAGPSLLLAASLPHAARVSENTVPNIVFTAFIVLSPSSVQIDAVSLGGRHSFGFRRGQAAQQHAVMQD